MLSLPNVIGIAAVMLVTSFAIGTLTISVLKELDARRARGRPPS